MSSEVRHKTRKLEKSNISILEKSDINQEELVKVQQTEARDKATAFINGNYWTQGGKMSSKGAMLFNNLMYSVAKNGEFNTKLSKQQALEIFNKREKNIRTAVSKGNFPKEKQEAIYKEIGWNFKPKEKAPDAPATQTNAPAPPATATPAPEIKTNKVNEAVKEMAPELEKKGRKLKRAQEKLKKTAEFHTADIMEDFEIMKKKIAELEHEDVTVKKMAEKLSEVRAEIPAEVINKEPENKPDELAPAPLENLTLDEKQRKIADTFPNTKALQTGCYETVRNTDYSRVHFNARELRPENNYTRGLTNKINVIQKVNVGNLNKYILR